MWPVKAGTTTIGCKVERILCDRDFGVRWVKGLRRSVKEAAPRIVDIGAKVFTQALVKAHLNRVVVGFCPIRTLAYNATGWVYTRAGRCRRTRGTDTSGIAVDGLE